MVREEGLAGIYKGYIGTTGRTAGSYGIRFMVHSDASPWLNKYIETKGICDMLGGSIGGIISVLCTHPIDVVKTRM